MGRLANKNILITGGNSGIGLAAARTAKQLHSSELSRVSTDIKPSFLTSVHMRLYRSVYAYVNRHRAEMMPGPPATR